MKNMSKRLLCVLLSLVIVGSVLPMVAPTTVEAASVTNNASLTYMVIPADVFVTGDSTAGGPGMTAVNGNDTYNASSAVVTDDDGSKSVRLEALGEGKVRQYFDMTSFLPGYNSSSAVPTTTWSYITVVYRVADHVHAPTEFTIIGEATTTDAQQTVTVDNSNRMYNSAMINVSSWSGNVTGVSIEFNAWEAGDSILIDSIIFTAAVSAARNRSYNQERERNGGFNISGMDIVNNITATTNMSVEYDPAYRAAKLTVTGDGSSPDVTIDLLPFLLKNGEQDVFMVDGTNEKLKYNRIAFVYYMPGSNTSDDTATAEMRLWLQTSDESGGTTVGSMSGSSYRHLFTTAAEGAFTTETIKPDDMHNDGSDTTNDKMLTNGSAYNSKIRYKYMVDSESKATVGDVIYIAAIIFYNTTQNASDVTTSIGQRVIADVPSDEARYGVKYDANGGTGAPATQVETAASASHTMTLSATVPARQGYNFLGWATDMNAVVPEYTAGGEMSMTGTINSTTGETLYAVWEASNDVYRITYDLQGGIFENENAVQYTYPNPSIEWTMTTVPTRPGYDFAGWKVTSVSGGAVAWTVDDIIVEGTTLENPAGNVTLEAQWTPSGTPIRYYLSSTYGTLSSNVEYVGVNGDGSTSTPVGSSVTSVATGYIFDGWYLDPACQSPVPEAWVTDGKLVPVLNVKTDGGDGVDAVLGYAFYAKVTPKMLSFRLSATCADDENQSFIYRITGTPKLTAVFGESVSVTVAVPAGETKTVTLPVGDYVITENVDWSWRYNESVEDGETEALEKQVAIVSQYEAVCARTFDYNIKKQDHWLNAYAASVDAGTRKEDETAE